MSEEHLKLLNASGYAFQLAIESAVRAASGRLEWRIVGREHPWGAADDLGFADIVLTCGNLYMVVECKRTRDAAWLFLMPDDKQLSRSHAKVAWVSTRPHRKALAGWGDVQIDPRSPESDFCAVRGQGEKDRPMLERVAAQVVAAADGLCVDLISLHEQSEKSKVVIPVIVTNADLLVAQFDPAKMDLSAGEVADAHFSAVPHVRFRKTLGPSSADLDYEPQELRDLAEGSVRTVFVVRADAFTKWLGELEISPNGGSWPWSTARARADI